MVIPSPPLAFGPLTAGLGVCVCVGVCVWEGGRGGGGYAANLSIFALMKTNALFSRLCDN